MDAPYFNRIIITRLQAINEELWLMECFQIFRIPLQALRYYQLIDIGSLAR